MKLYPNANPDLFTKVITGLLLLATLVALGFWAYSPDKDVRTAGMAIGLILLLCLTVGWLLIPALGKSATHFEIRTKLHAIEIPLNQIKAVTIQPQKQLHFRLFGVGGVFGYFGYFNGKEVWYVTNLKKGLKLETLAGKVYQVSPSDPQLLLEDLQKHINTK